MVFIRFFGNIIDCVEVYISQSEKWKCDEEVKGRIGRAKIPFLNQESSSS